MSDQSNLTSSNVPPQHRRRSSFAEMFNPRSSTTSSLSSSPPSAAVPSTPAVSQHRRGASITALGLTTGASGQTSPYNAFAKQRRASISTSSAASSPEFRNSFEDGPAVIEEDDHTQAAMSPPTSPSFARRVSFGAQALRDVRHGGGTGANGGGEGFNWSEAIRDRTKRSPSFSSSSPFAANTNRTRSVSTTAPEPPKEIAKAATAAPRMKKPDHLGERMLRGEFMMD